jgi:hypothetical protein
MELCRVEEYHTGGAEYVGQKSRGVGDVVVIHILEMVAGKLYRNVLYVVGGHVLG